MQENNYEKKARINLVIYVLSVSAGILLIYSFFSGLLILLISGNESNINPWLLALSQILFLLLPTFLTALSLKIHWKYIFRLNFPGIKFILLALAGVFFIELFTEGVVVIQKYIIPTAWQTGYERLLDDYMTSIKQIIGGGGVAVLLRSIVVVAFVPALSEEMFFRGFLQTSLEYSVRIIYAIVFTSFLFAVMHLNPILFIPLFVAGLFFGFISYLSSSIIVPFILHFVMNFLGIIEVFYQTDSGTAGQEALSLTTASVLFVVGITGISVISYLLYKMKRDIKTSLQS